MLDIHQLETELGLLVINLQSYWSNWCRALYMSSVFGTVTVSGAAISSGVGIYSERDALTVAIRGTLTPSRPPPLHWQSHQEPKWFDPSVLSRALADAKVNTATMSIIFLNSAASVLRNVRIFRNYYAHRSEQLKQDTLSLGPTYLVGSARNPSEILVFVEPMQTISVLEGWILDISRLAGVLCG
jgi:hypothetical protein